MLQNRNLSNNDKKRLLLLATQEIEKADASLGAMESNETEKEKKVDKQNSSAKSKHAPKETAAFLSLFSDPKGFKFLTHDFDPDSDMNYEKLMEQVKGKLKEADSKYPKYNIPSSLFSLMSVFINGKTNNGKYKTWKDCNGDEHAGNYSCNEWMDWAIRHPKIHLLSNKDFENDILKFRSSIRLVKPMLCDIIQRQASKHPNLNIQTDSLEKADFYTYVLYLEDGIRRILDDMSRYANKTPNIKISFERSYNDDYSKKIIKIIQLDSQSYSLDEVLKKFHDDRKKGGAFNEIKKVFEGYCNWSVEALWDGIAKRWNILNDENADEIEELNNENVIGFTHILTFYSK